jgi:uncharacterized membrane protein
MDTNTQGTGAVPPNTPPPGPGAPNQNTGMAIISYLGILVIVPLLTDAKNDPFVKFHIKQGLVLLIGFFIAGFIAAVPVLGWILSPLLWLACLVLMIVGIMNAAAGKQTELPVIGHLANNFHF